MTEPTVISKPYDVVVVPFPFSTAGGANGGRRWPSPLRPSTRTVVIRFWR